MPRLIRGRKKKGVKLGRKPKMKLKEKRRRKKRKLTEMQYKLLLSFLTGKKKGKKR